MEAEVVFKVAFFSIVGILCGVGIEDVIRAFAKQSTITDYLRENPGWYIWGSTCMVTFIVVLGLHLYYPFR